MKEIIEELKKKLASGDRKAALNSFVKYIETNGLDEETATQVGALVEENPDFQTDIDEYITSTGSSLETQKDNTEKNAKIQDRVRQATNVLGNILNLGASQRQVKAAQQGEARLKTPRMPSRFRRNPLLGNQLSRAMSEAQNPMMAPEMNAARQDLNQAFSADLNQSRVASGGQAGLYGSLAQSAANRRMRGSRDLGLLGNDLRRQALGRSDELLGMRMNEDVNKAQFDRQDQRTALYQFNTDRDRLDSLGSTGRFNRINAMRGLLQNVGSGVSNLDFVRNTLENPLFGEDNRPIGNPKDIMGDYETALNYRLPRLTEY